MATDLPAILLRLTIIFTDSSQNSEKVYGESITIYKVNELDEMPFIGEHYLNICLNKNNRNNL